MMRRLSPSCGAASPTPLSRFIAAFMRSTRARVSLSGLPTGSATLNRTGSGYLTIGPPRSIHAASTSGGISISQDIAISIQRRSAMVDARLQPGTHLSLAIVFVLLPGGDILWLLKPYIEYPMRHAATGRGRFLQLSLLRWLAAGHT